MSKTLQGWEPDTLRATIFFAASPGESEKFDMASVYSVVVESKTEAGPLKQITEVASFGPGKLVSTSLQNRLDIAWNADSPDGELALLGSSPDALRAFLDPLKSWLAGSNHTISRIALGGHHLKIVNNRSEGYQLLSEHIPFTVDAADTEDVLLQINRKGSASIGERPIRFNRVCRWGVKRFQSTTFIMSPAGAPIISGGPEIQALACEQDFNTPSDSPEPPYSSVDCSEFFEVLFNSSLHFLEHGDAAAETSN